MESDSKLIRDKYLLLNFAMTMFENKIIIYKKISSTNLLICY